MTYVSIGRHGLDWPVKPGPWFGASSSTIDAANETIAAIGRIHWADGGSHTLDTSGASKIYLHTGATAVFDDATSVMDIGIQDVDVATGVPARPDGTFDVKAVVTTAADTSPALTTTNSLVGVVPTTGTKTMAHGDLIAITAKLVTVGTTPAASVAFSRSTTGDFMGAAAGTNVGVSNASGSFASADPPFIALIVASDGTYGALFGAGVFGQSTGAAFSDSSNPDEYGNIFQVPFNCRALGLKFCGGLAGATSDFQYDLYSTPLGTPASMLGGAVSVAAEAHATGTTNTGYMYPFAPPVSLLKDTDYCAAVKAAGAGNVTIYGMTLPAAGARVLLPGGTTTRGATRNNGSGAFSESTTIIRAVSVVIDQLDFSSGGASLTSLFGI